MPLRAEKFTAERKIFTGPKKKKKEEEGNNDLRFSLYAKIYGVTVTHSAVDAQFVTKRKSHGRLPSGCRRDEGEKQCTGSGRNFPQDALQART